MFGLFRKKIVLSPLQKEILQYGRPSLFTPDLPLLEEYQRRLLFVADEWMKDRRQNFILDELGAVRRGSAFTFAKFQYRTFVGHRHDPQHINVALKSEQGFPIMGEVVELDPSSHLKPFQRLDKLRLNTVQFQRQRVILAMPYRDGPIVFENTMDDRRSIQGYMSGVDWLTGKFPDGHPLAGKKYWLGPEKIAHVRAMMYVGIPAYWSRWINTPFLFNRIPTFKPKKSKWWLTEYYKYQNPTE